MYIIHPSKTRTIATVARYVSVVDRVTVNLTNGVVPGLRCAAYIRSDRRDVEILALKEVAYCIEGAVRNGTINVIMTTAGGALSGVHVTVNGQCVHLLLL